MRKVIAILSAVLLATAIFAPVAQARPAGVARPDTEVGPYKCWVFTQQITPIKSWPESRQAVYLALLGWPGTVDEWWALTDAQRCAFYYGLIPPVVR